MRTTPPRRIKLLVALLSAACSGALGGCASGIMTIGFKRAVQTVHLRVGNAIDVRKSAGECGSPWTTNPRVITPEHPPRAGDCSPGTVRFKAVGRGNARINGSLPCRVPACTAAMSSIAVVVTLH